MKNLTFIWMFVLFAACGTENDVENVPANFIQKEQFIELVYEVNVLEGSLANFNLNKDAMKDSSMRLYRGLFDKFEIDYQDFKENQEYYILTDQYKEITEKALEKVEIEVEKYKDVKPVKLMSQVQFTQLFETDGFLDYMKNDTNTTYSQRLDSVLGYYRENPKSLESFMVDSISFEVNIAKIRKGRDLFRAKTVFEKKIGLADE